MREGGYYKGELTPVQIAWREGYNAADKGQSWNHNPYPAGEPEHDAWQRGFRQSERDDEPATE